MDAQLDEATIPNDQAAVDCSRLEAEMARLHALRIRAVSTLSWLCGWVEAQEDGTVPDFARDTLAALLEG